MIQDSHFFRKNRTNTDLYHFDGRLWFFTREGLIKTLEKSHKKNAKAVLRAFETRISELLNDQDKIKSVVPF